MSEIQFNPEQLMVVPIDQVRPNSWNPKDKNTKEFEIVKKSLETNGLRLPVVVRENKEGDSLYEIIDGEQRWTGWGALGHDKVLIYNEGKVTDQKAKELTIWYEQKVPFNEVKLAELVAHMVVDYQNIELPFSESQIQDMVELVKFDWDSYDVNKDNNPEQKEDEEFRTLSVTCTKEQYEVIQQAIAKIRDEANDTNMSEARAIELISANFLAE